jgi:hypothetical protein
MSETLAREKVCAVVSSEVGNMSGSLAPGKVLCVVVSWESDMGTIAGEVTPVEANPTAGDMNLVGRHNPRNRTGSTTLRRLVSAEAIEMGVHMPWKLVVPRRVLSRRAIRLDSAVRAQQHIY